MDEIAVLIPCFNEEKTIGKVVRDFKEALEDVVIYVYDNNSTDKTAEIAEAAGAVVRHEYKQGKGNVIRRMFMEIDAKVYLMVDGDDTYFASDAKKMVEAVRDRNADMVVGDRLSSTYFGENKRPFHNFGNDFVRKSINLLYKSGIKDVMTGYRAFSYRFIKTFPVLTTGFEIETEMTIHAIDNNLQIENVIIEYKDRPEGSESKLNTVSDGLKVIKTISKMYRERKPLHFFAWIAFLLFVIALILFIPVLVEYFDTGLVPRFPTLICSGFLVLVSVQSLFGGLILHTINTRNHQEFEMRLADKTREAIIEK